MPLHQRWVLLLRTMQESDFQRMVQLPNGTSRKLELFLGIYAWHGKHHIAHITALRDRMGW